MEEDEAAHSSIASQPMQIQHLCIHTEDKPFRCDRCGCNFNALANLHKHRCMKHNNVVKCEEGKLILNTDKKPFKCDQCGNSYLNKKDMLKHQRIKHQAEKLGKEIAIMMVEAPQKLLPNLSSQSARYWKYKGVSVEKECNQCGKSFPNENRLRIHKRIHEGKIIHKCKYCKTEFIGKSSLKIHERAHTGERPFKCDLCGKGFTQVGKFNEHKRTNHKETNNHLMCGLCGCEFPSPKHLKIHPVELWHIGKERHLRKGDTEKDYEIGGQSAKAVSEKKQTETPAPISTSGDERRKGFVTQQQLLGHQDLHEGEKLPKLDDGNHDGERLYSCDYCDWTSGTLENLDSHQLSRHPGKQLNYLKQDNFVPSVDPQIPALKLPKKDGIIKRDIKKPYKCDYCGKGFKSNCHLQEHRYYHIGKPYVCDICGYGFVREKLLQRHQKYCGRLVFSCRSCGENFPCRAQLRVHQQRFHDLHKCKHCNKSFTHTISLSMHIFHGKCHTEEEAPNKPGDGEKSTDNVHKYSCNCVESFSDPSSLATHKCNDQSTEKTFTCKDCGTLVQVGGTSLSNVFTVTDFSSVKCFINNHSLF